MKNDRTMTEVLKNEITFREGMKLAGFWDLGMRGFGIPCPICAGTMLRVSNSAVWMGVSLARIIQWRDGEMSKRYACDDCNSAR